MVYRQTVALIGSILLECLTSGIYKAVDLVPFKFANRLRGGGGVGLQLNETRSRLSFPVSSLLHHVFFIQSGFLAHHSRVKIQDVKEDSKR